MRLATGAELYRADRLSERIRRLRFTCPRVDEGWEPGDKILMRVAARARRAYTLSAVDAARRTFEIVAVAHDGGPGGRWVRDADEGQVIELLGPRRDVDTRGGTDGTTVMLGDETALGLFAALREGAGSDAEFAGAVERTSVHDGAVAALALPLRGVVRDGGSPGRALVKWLQARPATVHDTAFVVAGHRLAVRSTLATLRDLGAPFSAVRGRVYWG
ncbi:MAG: siderophore-interacting protein [Myxococcota bacterium]